MRVGSRFGAAMAAALGLCLSAGPGRAAPAPPLEVYGKLPGVELMELSPSGELFATVATVGEQRRLIVATIKGQLLIASPVGDAKVRKLTWANDQHLLVVASATYDLRADFGFKYELDKVLDVDVQKKSAQIVFDKMLSVAKVVRGVFGAASSGGHDYGYFGAITFTRTIGGDFTFDHGWRDLYRVDLDSGSATLFANGDEQSSDWVLAADGSVAARAEYNEKSGRWRLFARDSVLGKPLVDRSSPRDDIELVGLGRAPGAVIITDNSGDRSTLEEVSLAGGDATRLLKDRSISRYWFDPQSRLFIGVESPADPGEVFFDPQLQARWELARKAFPRRKLRLQSYTSGLQRMIVKSEGDGDPGTYWLVDTLAKTANQLGEDRPEIPSDAVGQTSLISYKAADGLEIEAVLTLPPGRDPKKLPVVVMPHGGPIDVGDEVGFDWWAQAFASRGYAVLQPNYRGSSGRDVAFREAGYGEWGRKMPSDIADVSRRWRPGAWSTPSGPASWAPATAATPRSMASPFSRGCTAARSPMRESATFTAS